MPQSRSPAHGHGGGAGSRLDQAVRSASLYTTPCTGTSDKSAHAVIASVRLVPRVNWGGCCGRQVPKAGRLAPLGMYLSASPLAPVSR